LYEAIGASNNVFLVGYQPRFLEMLVSKYNVKVVDMDPDNIGKNISGTVIEPTEMTASGVKWCDLIFATGSTIVNGTIVNFLNQDRPVLFYGVTISEAANILHLKKYCQNQNILIMFPDIHRSTALLRILKGE
jgi:uncharacterized protein (DUF4213/DUF364 family)